ncbi:NifB/NifX family molybdenum-iron cluster-binding protein [Adlercreutzia sp. ZJ473]|uniref:NifB/NifX family molybdenum-iron cluster-binding protein n=1 Tax=Adlercreutzia sp. ZJ473 TaxID=2722822 RepID=UPI001556436C|nr:NifB/NifX family molybdenum-iron cluster-binding protein [Adlercreutzia sp. ZJ473]
MKIAVACDGLVASAHAARCDSFMCYTIERGIIVDCRNLPNNGITSHEGARLIIDLGFDALITSGIDIDMADELCAAGVEVVAGAAGASREVVQSYISHTLMGAVPFCHADEDEEAEEDIEAAFAALEEKMQAADA